MGTGPDEERDAFLSAALRHAPDADVAAPPGISDAILREARSAAGPARQAPPASNARQAARGVAAAPSRSVGALWRWLGRPAVASGFASVIGATLIGLMWWGRPLDPSPPRPDAPPVSIARAPAAASDDAAAPAPRTLEAPVTRARVPQAAAPRDLDALAGAPLASGSARREAQVAAAPSQVEAQPYARAPGLAAAPAAQPGPEAAAPDERASSTGTSALAKRSADRAAQGTNQRKAEYAAGHAAQAAAAAAASAELARRSETTPQEEAAAEAAHQRPAQPLPQMSNAAPRPAAPAAPSAQPPAARSAPPAPAAAPTLAGDGAPLSARIGAAPHRWTWRTADGATRAMTPAVAGWIARFERESAGWDHDSANAAGAPAAPAIAPLLSLELQLDGRRQATLTLGEAGGAIDLGASAGRRHGPLAPGTVERLRRTAPGSVP